MATLETVLQEAVKLNRSIQAMLRLSTYQETGDLSGLDINYQDGEQIMLRDELRLVMDKLADVQAIVAYLNSPIVAVSRLRRGSTGRYETEDGRVYTCGNQIEALVSDGYHEMPYWTLTSVQHNGTDYYLAGNKSVSMDGLMVRVRKPIY